MMKCQRESGGFAGNIGYDPHILFTLSAVSLCKFWPFLISQMFLTLIRCQIILLGCKMKMDPFPGTCGAKWIHDSHLLPYVVSQILHRLDKINVDKVVNYIVSCKNLDGGFGCTHGGESHAGQSMFCI
ncbi:hypothetical protein Pint_02110 [Pistacia integerrima]|uniref:Uncharacterized protein n=1 Tax=Pistacia integerrima TaxID=434235 RepID=A0ACC0ZN57_9ROSI|nr:hypothetical protein Pint_02110 [Pistacia integerrima]